MKKSRLRSYILLSVVLHILLLWALRFLPAADPTPLAPVAIQLLPPPQEVSRPPSVRQELARKPPEPQAQEPPQTTPKPPPPPPKQGGVLAELPKPVQEQRPDQARILSQYDSTAQDVGPGEKGAQKPSGENPREMPPELALPERYSKMQPTPPPAEIRPPAPSPQPAPPSVRPQPTPKPRVQPPPTPQQQARLQPSEPRVQPEMQRQPDTTGTMPTPPRQEPPEAVLPKEEPRFRISTEQELAMLQRERESSEKHGKQTLEEHFTHLEKRLPLPSFDAPGVYERGPERPGEGQRDTGGGKYQSIDSFGLKHFSYLIGIKRKIELVFSVPFFVPNNGGVGVPIVGFTIRRSGELAEAVLLRSSGYAVVDKALLEAIKRAAPYGPFPEHLPEQEISIRVYATIS
jgi:protein TonB